jgi:hypothetical protein
VATLTSVLFARLNRQFNHDVSSIGSDDFFEVSLQVIIPDDRPDQFMVNPFATKREHFGTPKYFVCFGANLLGSILDVSANIRDGEH